jgi:hypothetical protein
MTLIYHLTFFLLFISNCSGFVPAKLISSVIGKFDAQFEGNFGKVSESIVHDEILRRGLIQSVVRYFYNQTNGSQKINLNKINNDYYDLKKLYYDYYGKYICDIPLSYSIKSTLQPSVASVDLDPTTKDLPYAHFDAETFSQSNSRVISFINKTMNALRNKQYLTAQISSAQSLYFIIDPN